MTKTAEKSAPGFDMSGRQEIAGPVTPGETSWTGERLLDAIADVEEVSARRYQTLRREIDQLKRRRGIAGELGGLVGGEDLYQALAVFVFLYAGAMLLQRILAPAGGGR